MRQKPHVRTFGPDTLHNIHGSTAIESASTSRDALELVPRAFNDKETSTIRLKRRTCLGTRGRSGLVNFSIQTPISGSNGKKASPGDVGDLKLTDGNNIGVEYISSLPSTTRISIPRSSVADGVQCMKEVINASLTKQAMSDAFFDLGGTASPFCFA